MRKIGCWLAAAALYGIASIAQAQISDGVVRIGVLTDMSGQYSDLTGSGSVTAARMAVEDSGVARRGLRVEVIGADHQNRPDVGSNLAREWYDVGKVDVIVDLPTSSVALAVNEIARAKGKALVISGAGTSDLTGKACAPTTLHWTYDTWMLSNSTGRSIATSGGDTWFFVTADFAFGHALERDTEAVVTQSGGKVLGRARHPFGSPDFSSFLLQAQASKAKIVALANAGGDSVNAIKAASEFGLTRGGQQRLAGLLMTILDVHGLGLEKAQGLLLTETFYWDMNDATRDWTKRFVAANKGKYPTMVHAGVYSSVLHYIKAVEQGNSDDGAAVTAKMKALPTDDPLFGQGRVRPDGRKLHPAYLFEVKKPGESKGPYDYYTLRATVPSEQAFRPMESGDCPLAKK